ncbi:hypothetical protein VTJ83DRAFT_2284 [Remersonia thermophila]|uniref:Superoxide dismutase copper/zinc binding domain-containing protein n=1 Tax=Remersonia thermophila TaxID=72144 RepID=A0ABR4DID9_9PEZI
MRTHSTLPLLLAASGAVSAQQQLPDGSWTGKRGEASVITNNPLGYVYEAVFPEEAFFKPAYPNGGNIEGSVTAEADPTGNGTGVRFTLTLSNLPPTDGALLYHIHAKPVPADGNCTATAAHFDPFERGQQPPCDASAPETCEVGDLSGKHGAIPANSTSFTYTFLDLYASTEPTNADGFFGDLSVVIHLANTTRVTCANFQLVRTPDDGDDGDDGDEVDDDISTFTGSFLPTPSSIFPEPSFVPSITDSFVSVAPTATSEPSSPSETTTVRPVPTDILNAGEPVAVARAGAAVVAAVVGAVFML